MKFNSAFLFCEWNVIFDGPSNISFHSQNKKQPSEDGRPRSCLEQKGPKSES